MKRTYIFLLAALCTIGVNAQNIHLWHNGIKTDLPTQTNDSITFDETNTPTMHFWRDGSEIYQWTLAVNDSITYSQGTAPQPSTSGFTYENWREQTKISIYGFDEPVALPWADGAQTSIPEDYKDPEKEMQADGVTPRWQLAFNLCDSSSLPGTNMFGLWDANSQIMRIYTYIEGYVDKHSCFYEFQSSAPAFVDNDTKGWQPSDTTIKICNWNGAAIGGAKPSTTYRQAIPVTGTLSGQINGGWVCFELNFAAGIFDISKDAFITITLYGVEKINFTGSFDLGGELTGKNGKITIPGNKAKTAEGVLTSIGSCASTVCSFISDGIKQDKTECWWADGFGMLGAVVSMVGGFCNAGVEDQNKEYKLNIDFNISASGEFNGSLNSIDGTMVKPIEVRYNLLLSELLKHKTAQQANAPAKTQKAETPITLGAWNLKHQPIIYVATDAVYHSTTTVDYLVSFLDPTSIEPIFNTNNTFFPYDEIDSVAVVAYDFMFINDDYTMTEQPYYNFYSITNDPIVMDENIKSIDLEDVNDYHREDEMRWYYLNPNTDAPATIKNVPCVNEYEGITSYAGVVATETENDGMDVYNMMYSPAISRLGYCKSTIDNIGVAVILEVTFKNGEKRFFADRFLPQIKTFKATNIAEAQAIMKRIANAPETTTIDNITWTYPLLSHYKGKTNRLLDDFHRGAYEQVTISNQVTGLRVKSYDNEQSKGLVIVTSYNALDHVPSFSSVESLRNYLVELDDWDNIADGIRDLDMVGLNHCFLTTDTGDNGSYSIKYGVNCGGAYYKEAYINIYEEDANGNLTLVE